MIKNNNSLTSSYQRIKKQKFSLENLKKEQNIRPITEIELKQLAIDTDIKESTDHLLTDIKSLG
ncbi:MAG: hypothetical protein AAF806_08020 [Bacteroidota bacterium]